MNFFGTNCYLLKGEVKRRVRDKHGLQGNFAVEAARIKDTAVIGIQVAGGSEEENRKYLDALIAEFFAFRAETREKAFRMKIAHLEEALAVEKDKEIQDRLREMLADVKVASLTQDDVIERIK